MAIKSEGKHGAEFIASERRETASRDTAILSSGSNLIAGTVIGKITATGKLLQCIPAAVDGSQVAAGVLLDNVDATAGDTVCVIISRQAELDKKEMNYGA
jgi:hypothetical protein